MTKFLSEALEAKEPYFRHGLRRLEAANGNPSSDIHLTSEIIQANQTKLKQLQLDPKDTTEKELYQALLQKAAQDDKVLTKHLRTLAATYVSAEADPVAGMIEAINRLDDSKRCYSLKTSRLKSMIRKNPPKRAMKSLGYRSLESMLKHESTILIMAAAWLSESQTWRKKLNEQYKKLGSADFEDRKIAVLSPTGPKWQKLSQAVVEESKNNILSFKELGAVVLLPLPSQVPAGAVTLSLALALSELNDIRACSTFLKLNQVRPDFGEIIVNLIDVEPELNSKLLDQPVPWNLIQRYYSRLDNSLKGEIFEPYIRLEDMVWHPIEETLSKIEKRLSFWQDSSYIAHLKNKQAISCNLLDVALNLCNSRTFETRVNHYFKRSLWHELLLRYFQHEPVEQSLLSELTPDYAMELA
jgi:hypothetical protein